MFRTSRSASSTRPRDALPHTRLVAASAATLAHESSDRRDGRASTSALTAAAQRIVYHCGHWPGAFHTIGASAAATTAITGPSQPGTPAVPRRARRPDQFAITRSAVAARESGTHQMSQSVPLAPSDGG